MKSKEPSGSLQLKPSPASSSMVTEGVRMGGRAEEGVEEVRVVKK